MKNLDKKWQVIIIVAASVLVLGLATFFIIKIKAYQTYLAGVEAHRSLDTAAAITQYQEIANYPKIIGRYIGDTRDKLAEVQAYADADGMWAAGEYPQAQLAFAAFLKAYPTSVFNEKGYQAILDIPFEWAGGLLDGTDYEGAAEVYAQIIQDEDVPDAVIEEAQIGYIDSYNTWAASEFKAGNDAESESLMDDLVSWADDNAPMLGATVIEVLGETYLDWGDILYEDGKYKDALAKYDLAVAQDISSVTDQAEESIGSVYLDWGDELFGEGELAEAGEKYGLLYLDYGHTDAAEQIPDQACEPLILFGDTVLSGEDFSSAETIYAFAGTLAEEGREELKAAAGHGLGLAYHGQERYFESIPAFDKALTLTEDETTTENVKSSRQASIDAIGHLTDTLGNAILFIVSNNILEYDEDESNCYVDGAVKTCLTEEELATTYLALGQEEDEKRLLLFFEGGELAKIPDDIEAVRPGHFRHVGILTKSDRRIQSCPYSLFGYGSATHHLVRWVRIYTVTMYDARTGRRVQTREFAGDYPDTCPSTYFFSSATANKYGESPEIEDVYDWLRRFTK
ncbi:MAG: hypothetical protein PVF83_10705 [Anaerolineales bacterium]